ncbi:deoxyribose-phosphate aldolase [Rapidithrix thailandica]|uniref:Deoxyribose-phosphate aldolase n=1 Tax=Rapidithrix thailandica TaxID=413964 RepID=A0AAW9RT91_9BACT
MKMKKVNQYLEQTVLTPTATRGDMEQLVKETIQYQFLGVCVPSFWVKKVKRDLRQFSTKVVAPIGFPLGYQHSEAKVAEARQALTDGADELDMVMNLSAFKSGDTHWPKVEIAQLSKLAHENDAFLKVIIETAYLSKEEIITTCKLCADAGADFVKTSTGFAPSGAQVEDIRLMRTCLPDSVGIKASGGIKTYAQAVALIEAGADRIGTSSGVNIMNEAT